MQPHLRDVCSLRAGLASLLLHLQGRVTMTERMSWELYFLGVARAVAARADCTRSQVGAVLVDRYNRIRSTGYNGSPPGGPSCGAGECPRGTSNAPRASLGGYDEGPGACIALHAEHNALLWCDPDIRRGATVYLTREPCLGCWRMLAGAGIARVIWATDDAGHFHEARPNALVSQKVPAVPAPAHRIGVVARSVEEFTDFVATETNDERVWVRRGVCDYRGSRYEWIPVEPDRLRGREFSVVYWTPDWDRDASSERMTAMIAQAELATRRWRSDTPRATDH